MNQHQNTPSEPAETSASTTSKRAELERIAAQVLGGNVRFKGLTDRQVQEAVIATAISTTTTRSGFKNRSDQWVADQFESVIAGREVHARYRTKLESDVRKVLGEGEPVDGLTDRQLQEKTLAVLLKGGDVDFRKKPRQWVARTFGQALKFWEWEQEQAAKEKG